MPSNMQLQTLDGYINGLPSCQMLPSLLEMNPQQSSSVSNNSTSDEAEQHQYSIIDERKQRRMISNRESARRSRMRKQKHLDELWSQVIRLRTENHALLDKFNHVFESHNNVVEENVKLKDEVSKLRKMVTNLQITSPETFLRDLEEIPCNMDNAREASSNHSISSSIDLLD
ncbi:unnamed protein product [Rhodiola kirilowii]